MKHFLLLILTCFFFSAKAEISLLLLSDGQCRSLSQWSNTDSLNNSTVKRLAQKDTAFATMNETDLNHLLDVVIPANKQVYKQNDSIYKLCAKLATQIMLHPPDLANVLWPKQESGQPSLANQNLAVYLQQQLFDFYYNNNVVSYLQNPEYISLLQSKPLFKLLSDTKGKEILEQEIQFLINNNKYKIY